MGGIMNSEPAVRAVREYLGADRLEGPLAFIQRASDVGYGEVGEIIAPDGSLRFGQVLEVSEEHAIVQLWGESRDLRPSSLRIRFLGHALQVPVAEEMLGRVFDGLGEPRDGLPAPIAEQRVFAQGSALNPVARAYPENTIVTGISAIDCMNTLVRGQKLPIFSGSGLPHNDLASQIARQAHIAEEGQDFAIIFVALGVSHDTARSFQQSLEESGALRRSSLFLNLADDPSIERIVTPHVALSLAEFLAFDRGMHVLVIMTDMTNYGEAMREVSIRREEVPTRKGYPGHLYSDLANIYERCGRAHGRSGSITQMPVLTMPNDDITHPVPDLTGYITEGQIVFSRDLHDSGIYPPIGVLHSLSRLMKDAIGKGKTRADHPNLSNQLYASYAHSQEVRDLAEIIGEDGLNPTDKRYLDFGIAFEGQFVNQGAREARDLDETLDLGWKMLGNLPTSELRRVTQEQIQEHYPQKGGGGSA
jgi:V/A-type H+-transporting ATPase subunit B